MCVNEPSKPIPFLFAELLLYIKNCRGALHHGIGFGVVIKHVENVVRHQGNE